MSDINTRMGDFLSLTQEQSIRLGALKVVLIQGTLNYARTILNSTEISQRMFGETQSFEDYKGIIEEDLISSGILKSYFTSNSKAGLPLKDTDWSLVNRTVAENTFLISLILDPKAEPENNEILNNLVKEVWKIVGEKIKKNDDLPKIILGIKDWGIKAKHFDKKNSKETRQLMALVATRLCDSIISSCTDFLIQADKERNKK